MGGSQKTICEAFHEKMREHWNTVTETNSNFKPLFKKFTINNRNQENSTREPIPDDKRFHCEDLEGELKYKPIKRLQKSYPTKVPKLRTHQLQYIMQGSSYIAKLVGGEEMNQIYSSLLVSKPGGVAQSWHSDVHENHAPGRTVLAMIVSLQEGTTVDVRIRGKTIPISIPPGFAMVFDAKKLIHRGVGYKSWNARIYLKFSTQQLSDTLSGESEVTPEQTCPGCKEDIHTNRFSAHTDTCIEYWIKVGEVSKDRAIKIVENNIKSNKKKYAKYNKTTRKRNQNQKANQEKNQAEKDQPKKKHKKNRNTGEKNK